MKTIAQLLKAKDPKNQDVHTVQWDHTVFEALVRMSEKNVGALPVLKKGKVVGIISERDYARKIMLKGLSSVTTKVHQVMSSPVRTVDTRKSVEECMNIMTNSHLRHLPVVEGGKLLGLLSIGDLVKEAIAEQADLIKQLEQYIRGE
ncbi:CBS domain-containing protein [Pseudomonas sp. S1_E04]